VRHSAKVQALGYRTDVAIRVLEGSVVEDRGEYLVIRSLDNPNFWWGNFLLLRSLLPGSGSMWIARFEAEFPTARHVTLGVDVPEDGALHPAELLALGLDFEASEVLTAHELRPPPHPNTAATYRVLAGDDDWRQAESLRMAAAEQDTDEHAEFNRARIASERALTEAGHGAWWGAFLDGQLVASLGVVPIGEPDSGERPLARYQHVETHPGFRRQGLAGTLAWHAGQSVLTSRAPRCGAAGTLVIVADPADVAIRVYRSVGFAETERQYAFARPPA
jgi:hypothetical protein